ncbi:MAG: hypothetical protein R2715_08125 [Ilumatobacteraceae bacterium]
MKYMLLLASNLADEPTPASEAFGPTWTNGRPTAEHSSRRWLAALQDAHTATTVQVRAMASAS